MSPSDRLDVVDLLILALATLYVAYAVGWSHGPGHVFEKLRERFPLGGLTTCTFCLALWAALALYLVWQTPLQPAVYVLAVAGAAVAIGTYTGIGEE